MAVKNTQLVDFAKIRDTNRVATAMVVSTRKTITRFNITGFRKVFSLTLTCVSIFDPEEPINSLIDTTGSFDSTVFLAAILQNQ